MLTRNDSHSDGNFCRLSHALDLDISASLVQGLTKLPEFSDKKFEKLQLRRFGML